MPGCTYFLVEFPDRMHVSLLTYAMSDAEEN